MVGIVAAIVISIVFCAICVAMARKRHRNTMVWGFLGLCFWFIPVVILALIGNDA